jgi:hypothetical protein
VRGNALGGLLQYRPLSLTLKSSKRQRNLESLTCSVETSEKLKSAGFPQETILSWFETSSGHSFVRMFTRDGVSRICAAVTAQEIADQLPSIEWGIIAGDKYGLRAITDNLPAQYADTMAEALAALWLYLAGRES